jgi:hypothetical protein
MKYAPKAFGFLTPGFAADKPWFMGIPLFSFLALTRQLTPLQ